MESPLKSRTEGDLVQVYQKLIMDLRKKGVQFSNHWLDNEAPEVIKQFDSNNNISYQLVPPNVHRRNADEWVIRTWKTTSSVVYVLSTNNFCYICGVN